MHWELQLLSDLNSYISTTEPAIFWENVTFHVYFFNSSIMTLHSLTHTIHIHATSISKRSQSSVLTLCWKHNRTQTNTANRHDSAITNKRFYCNASSEGAAKVKQHAEPKKACWDLSLFLDFFFLFSYLQIRNCCFKEVSFGYSRDASKKKKTEEMESLWLTPERFLKNMFTAM